MSKAEWFLIPRKVAQPRLRLFCFPYAGASASLPVFREWARTLPDDVELATLELPGRGRRYGEPLIGELPVLIESVTRAIAPRTDQPYAFFGHSIGALIAFELVRSLVAHGTRLPELLMVSGKRAPQLPHDQRLHLLPDAELVEALKDYNGTPDDVLSNPELMDLFLPILRADFSLAETYSHVRADPLPIPIHAFGGIADPGVKESCLRDWGQHTANSFRCEMFPGDHFFIHGHGQAGVHQRVMGLLDELLAPARTMCSAA